MSSVSEGSNLIQSNHYVINDTIILYDTIMINVYDTIIIIHHILLTMHDVIRAVLLMYHWVPKKLEI